MRSRDNLGIFLVRELYYRAGEHQMSAYAAQIAYFFVLSIFPFLIIAFAVLGKLEITYTVVSSAYQQLVPFEAYQIIDGYIETLLSAKLEAVVPISLLASLWTASQAVGALERALNRAHEVASPRRYIKSRLFGLMMTVLLLSLLLISIVLPNLTSDFLDWLSGHLHMTMAFRQAIAYGRWLLLGSLFLVVLTLIQMVMPNVKLTIREVWPGVLVNFGGWGVLSIGFSGFVRYFSNISFVYGSLGAVITLMIWLYFVGLLIMFGAEVNAAIIKYYQGVHRY